MPSALSSQFGSAGVRHNQSASPKFKDLRDTFALVERVGDASHELSGYRWGYSIQYVAEALSSSTTCRQFRIRPGEPTEDVRRRPPTSIDVRQNSCEPGFQAVFLIHQRPQTSRDFHLQPRLLWGTFRVSGDRVGRVPHTCDSLQIAG